MEVSKPNAALCARLCFQETSLRLVTITDKKNKAGFIQAKIFLLQEEFEGHVVEHFSYEESETLRNFDTVPDAFWPGIEHNPEL